MAQWIFFDVGSTLVDEAAAAKQKKLRIDSEFFSLEIYAIRC